ncbi:uncharacterized protein LOC126733578 [Anthonomus grandis grandis]|uniref:uncharacterized protein LOC126733578 n=1 Tax=Anthonomus grandis grandis TaxID=2921223 RepID=UPI0021652D25|nr:uncharacterized protein LOC126733578 [Anthonomus grandis grandis]
MFGRVVQVTLVFLLTFLNTQAKKPPGYVAPPKEYDPNPPKYEYGYKIQDDKSTHGKDEQRDGIYAQGRYYVENGKNSNQSVKYFADDWGYHPVVEYSSAGPHSKTSTNFALGIEAIKLKNNQKSIPQDPSDPGKAANLAKLDPPAITEPAPEVTTIDQLLPNPDQSGEAQDPSWNKDPQQPLFYYVQPVSSNLESFIFKPAEEQKLQLLEHPEAPETAKLIKPPDHIVQQLEPKHTNIDFKNLIDSTKNLVSGEDVLNINAAAANESLESLLEQFITPTIVDNHLQANAATPPPEASLLQEPIVVADSSDKPVDEKTDENISYASSTARSTINALQGNPDVIVTPRPVSSNTAGVQLQNAERPLVQIQKTIPYYLGMYEYPTELNADNATSLEQAAVENIELGKTLLYFPHQEPPRAEALQANIESNHVEFESKKDALLHEYIYERPKQELIDISPKPIEVTKYIDRPYPVEVPVPYPQPYPVEKIVKQIVKEPYPIEVKVPVPVEKVIERKIPVPYYIEKPIEKIVEKPVPHYIDRPATSSQAFLLHIPGLFTQQKYNTLVQNTWQQPLETNIKYSGYPIVYAPQYFPGKQNIPINKSHNKLRKLNLLVFPPRGNYFNLPPITKNPNDLVQNKYNYQTFRHSNAQLNNAYLPPTNQNINKEHQNDHIGLVPPKKQFIQQDHQAAASVATAHSINRPTDDHFARLPPKKHYQERGGRSFFDDKSVRLEYGFMPPLIPSLEIDEHGQPIERDDNKH